MSGGVLVTRLCVAVLVAGTLSACGGEAGGDNAPAPEPGAATCPDTFSEQAASAPTRSGDLVPAGAVDAILCVYPFATQDKSGEYRLGQSIRAADKDRDGLVKYLNALGSDSGAVRSCTLMGHDQYQIVLGYPGSTHVLVRVDYNCGTVSSAGALRQLDRVDSLLGYWPTVR